MLGWVWDIDATIHLSLSAYSLTSFTRSICLLFIIYFIHHITTSCMTRPVPKAYIPFSLVIVATLTSCQNLILQEIPCPHKRCFWCQWWIWSHNVPIWLPQYHPSLIGKLGSICTPLMLNSPILVQNRKLMQRKASTENAEFHFVGGFLVYKITTYIF